MATLATIAWWKREFLIRLIGSLRLEEKETRSFLCSAVLVIVRLVDVGNMGHNLSLRALVFSFSDTLMNAHTYATTNYLKSSRH